MAVSLKRNLSEITIPSCIVPHDPKECYKVYGQGKSRLQFIGLSKDLKDLTDNMAQHASLYYKEQVSVNHIISMVLFSFVGGVEKAKQFNRMWELYNQTDLLSNKKIRGGGGSDYCKEVRAFIGDVDVSLSTRKNVHVS